MAKNITQNFTFLKYLGNTRTIVSLPGYAQIQTIFKVSDDGVGFESWDASLPEFFNAFTDLETNKSYFIITKNPNPNFVLYEEGDNQAAEEQINGVIQIYEYKCADKNISELADKIDTVFKIADDGQSFDFWDVNTPEFFLTITAFQTNQSYLIFSKANKIPYVLCLLPTPTPSTSTPAPTPTSSPEPTNTASPEPTSSLIPTASPVPTNTASPSPTNTASPIPTNTATPEPTSSPTPTSSPFPTNTASPVPTNTASPIPTNTATPTQTSNGNDNITWLEPQNISSESDVSLNGLLVMAANFGSASSTTVNGVTFNSFSVGEGANTFTSGNITLVGTGTHQFGLRQANLTSVAAPYSALSTEYKNLLSPIIFSQNGTPTPPPAKITVTLSGLTIGQQYEIQYWVNDPRGNNVAPETGDRQVQIGSRFLKVNTNPFGESGGLGQWILGKFYANATTQSFDAIGAIGGPSIGPVSYACAMQVRALLPFGHFIYGINEEGDIYEVNPISKISNKLYSTGMAASNAVSYDNVRDQIFFFDNSSNLKCLDQNNNYFQIASASQMGLISIPWQIANASYYNNSIWFFSDGTSNLLRLNMSYSGVNNTPSIASIDTYVIANMDPQNNIFGDIAINANTGILYGANTTGRFFSLNLNTNPTNTLTILKSAGSGNPSIQLAFNLDYSVLYAQEYPNGKWYGINTSNGNLTNTNLNIYVSSTNNARGLRDMAGSRANSRFIAPTSTPTPTSTPISTPTPTRTPTSTQAPTSLSGMNIGGWGDPQFYIQKLNSVNASNKMLAKFLSRWSDNKDSNNELKFIDIETTTDLIQVFYTTGLISRNRRVIRNIRVVHNNITTTFGTNDIETIKKITAGPITVSAIKKGTGSDLYLNFETSWNTINNLYKFGGAAILLLKKIAAQKNGYFDGGFGRNHDGIGLAGQAYNITRSYFEANSFRASNFDPNAYLTQEELGEIATQLDGNLPEISYTEGIPEEEIDWESVSDLENTINNHGSISQEVEFEWSQASSSTVYYPKIVRSQDRNVSW